MRSFRHPWRQSDLERRLRSERPEPSDDFVRLVSGASHRERHERRSVVPKVAVVGALTAVLLAALGATGSVGSAHNAISGFTANIRDVVHVSSKHSSKAEAKASVARAQGSMARAGHGAPNGLATTSGNQARGSGHDHAEHPFQHQYGHKQPICHNGHTLLLPPPAVRAHLLHHPGDTPGPCPPTSGHGSNGGHGGSGH